MTARSGRGRAKWILAVVSIACALILAPPARARVLSVTVPVRGMTCALCARSVEESIRGLGGIRSVRVTLSGSSVRAEAADGSSLRIAHVRDRVRRAGFAVGGECEAEALGSFVVGPARRIDFRVTGTGTVYQVLEGHHLLRLMKRYGRLDGRFRVAFRLHDHPLWSPSAITILDFDRIDPPGEGGP